MSALLAIDRRKLICFITALFLIVSIIEIWAVNRLSTYGEKISKIERQKQELTLENQTLENEIAKRASLSEVEKYATAFGFESTTKIGYLPSEGLALGR